MLEPFQTDELSELRLPGVQRLKNPKSTLISSTLFIQNCDDDPVPYLPIATSPKIAVHVRLIHKDFVSKDATVSTCSWFLW